MKLIDKIVGYVNPKRAYEMQRYRMASEILEQYQDKQRAYDAATKGRRGDGWKSTGTSANAENYYALATLRNRSRELVRNNPYAKKIVKVVPNNVIGTGIRPTPLAESKTINKRIKKLWKDWAEETACDFDGMHNIYGLQKLAMRAVIESGEVIIARRRSTNPLMPIELQVMESDHIDTSKSQEFANGAGFILQGIEFDSRGKKVAMWVYPIHPGEQTRYAVKAISERIPMEDIIHLYAVERPGQVRGIPQMVSSMLRMKDFDDYEDAQLIRQKIAACFSVFVMDSADSVLTGDTKDVEMAERVEPGIIEHLPPGKDVKFANPPGADGYADYSRKIQQGIAAGSGITYEAMTGDFSGVNFSSGRMGWIEMQRDIEDWQWNVFVPQFCSKVWKWFIEAGKITGAVRSDVSVSWVTPRREMIDPVKETNAKVSQIGAGLKSLTEALAEDGYEIDEVLQQISDEQKKMKELGIVLTTMPAQDIQQVEVTP